MLIRAAGFALTAVLLTAAPVFAQTYLKYRCEDGAQFSVAFIEQSKSAYVQLDGKSIILPRRLSGSGSRYKKGAVTIWIKGNDARLKRQKQKWTQCKTDV
jgi:membrane-bound inhibitor of C-type lysozyme